MHYLSQNIFYLINSSINFIIKIQYSIVSSSFLTISSPCYSYNASSHFIFFLVPLLPPSLLFSFLFLPPPPSLLFHFSSFFLFVSITISFINWVLGLTIQWSNIIFRIEVLMEKLYFYYNKYNLGTKKLIYSCYKFKVPKLRNKRKVFEW